MFKNTCLLFVLVLYSTNFRRILDELFTKFGLRNTQQRQGPSHSIHICLASSCYCPVVNINVDPLTVLI